MKFLSKKLITLTKAIIYFCLFSMITSCIPLTKITEEELERANNEIIDPEFGLSRKEFKDALKPRNVRKDENRAMNYNSKNRHYDNRNNNYRGDNDYSYRDSNYNTNDYIEPSIPEASSILSTPTPSSIMSDKLISISVTEDIPLKDVLIELSRLADVDMEIDPRIDGGIILRVKDKPFKDVIERVVNLGGLRYSARDGVMRVERDTPYKIDYPVDFLNVTRSSESSINVDTQGLGGSDAELPSGSASSTTQTSEADVWASIEEAITNILNFTRETNLLGTARFEEVSESPEGSSFLQLNRQAHHI